MYLTKKNLEDIEDYLKNKAVKDSDLSDASPLTGEEYVTIVQEGKNKKVKIKSISSSISGELIPKRKILEKKNVYYNGEVVRNALTQEDFLEEDTTYDIRYNFTVLDNIRLPKGTVLEFNGGMLSTKGDEHIGITAEYNCSIKAPDNLQIFSPNLVIYNIIYGNVKHAYAEWFGAGKSDDDSQSIMACLYSFNRCDLLPKEYIIKNDICIAGKAAVLSGEVDTIFLLHDDAKIVAGYRSTISNITFDNRSSTFKRKDILSIASENCKLENLRFIGNNYIRDNAISIIQELQNSVIRNIKVESCDYGIYVVDSSVHGLVVENFEIRNSNYGIFLDTDGKLSNCDINITVDRRGNIMPSSADLTSCVLENCLFSYNYIGGDNTTANNDFISTPIGIPTEGCVFKTTQQRVNLKKYVFIGYLRKPNSSTDFTSFAHITIGEGLHGNCTYRIQCSSADNDIVVSNIEADNSFNPKLINFLFIPTEDKSGYNIYIKGKSLYAREAVLSYGTNSLFIPYCFNDILIEDTSILTQIEIPTQFFKVTSNKILNIYSSLPEVGNVTESLAYVKGDLYVRKDNTWKKLLTE